MSNGVNFGGIVERVGIAGYVAGGDNGSALSSSISKILFVNDVTASVANTLQVTRTRQMSARNQTTMYQMGGANGPGVFTNTIERMIFSSEVTSTVANPLVDVIATTGSASSPTAGYTHGGALNGVTYTTKNEKLLFATETTSSFGGAAGSYKLWCGVFDATRAFFGGGDDGSVSYGNIDRLTFSSDTVANLGVLLIGFSSRCPSVSDSVGYWSGGSNSVGSYTTSIQKINFSNESVGSVSSGIHAAIAVSAGSSSYVKGYICGGSLIAGTALSTVDLLQFSNEAVTLCGSTLSVVRKYAAGSEHLNAPLGSA
jgi:hypothetical protein